MKRTYFYYWDHFLKMKNNGKPFLIYGDAHPPTLDMLLKTLGICTEGVVDDDLSKEEKETRYGRTVCFDTVLQRGIKEYNYLIPIDYCITLQNKLKEAGAPDEQVLWLNFNALGIDPANDIFYMVEHYDGFKNTCEIFNDEKSKKQYWEMVKFRMDSTEERLYSMDINAYNQYFDDIVPLGDDEVFVDVGSFDGKTTVKFIERVKGNFQKVFLVEASRSNMELTRDTLARYGEEKFTFLPYAACDKPCRLCFNSDLGSGSVIDENGDTLVNGDALDNLIHERVTYIKMDIEGAEQAALLGCRRLIKEYRPKLAISIYHSSQDMLQIPNLLKKITVGYSFYFRQHGEGMGESICYGIPD